MSKWLSFLFTTLVGNLLLVGSASAQSVYVQIQDCMDITGMALYGGHSAATVKGNVSWLFGGPGGGEVYCGPEFGGSAQLSAGGGTGRTSFYGSTGIVSGTLALASPNVGGTVQGYHKVELILEFRVVPDDPTSTDPVDVDFFIREESFNVDTQLSGLATATNGFRSVYNVNMSHNLASTNYAGNPGQWYSEFPRVPYTTIDQGGTVSIVPNQDTYFHAYLEMTAIAVGFETPPSSSAVTNSLRFSFEATTEGAATIVFSNEDLLGLDPPQLNSVPEPGMASALSIGVFLISALESARSRRRPGRRGIHR